VCKVNHYKNNKDEDYGGDEDDVENFDKISPGVVGLF